jgi:hypothetical protein
MPVDAEPHPDGTAILRMHWSNDLIANLDEDGMVVTVRLVPVGQPLQPGEQRRRTHWSTCPNAKTHRSAR